MKFKYLTEQNNILKTKGTVAHYLSHLSLKSHNQKNIKKKSLSYYYFQDSSGCNLDISHDSHKKVLP